MDFFEDTLKIKHSVGSAEDFMENQPMNSDWCRVKGLYIHIPFTIFPWRVIKFHSVIIFVCIGHNEITSYEYGKGMFNFFFSWCSNMSCKELGKKTIIFWYIIFFKKKAPHMVFYSFRGNPKFVGISSCFMPQEEEKASSNRNKKKLEQNCWRQLFTF